MLLSMALHLPAVEGQEELLETRLAADDVDHLELDHLLRQTLEDLFEPSSAKLDILT